MVEKLNAVQIVAAWSLPHKNQILFWCKFLCGLNCHLSVHWALHFWALVRGVACLASYVLAIYHLVLNQTVLHKVIQLLVLVVSVNWILITHGTSHLGRLYLTPSDYTSLSRLSKGNHTWLRDIHYLRAISIVYLSSRNVRYSSLLSKVLGCHTTPLMLGSIKAVDSGCFLIVLWAMYSAAIFNFRLLFSPHILCPV